MANKDRKAKQRGGRRGLTPAGGATLKLPDNHGWTAAEGYQVFVANKGDVRFEFPAGWTFSHGKSAVTLSDKPSPHESVRVSLTIFHLPPEAGASWRRDTDLAELVRDTTREDASGQRDDGTTSPYPRRPASEITRGTGGGAASTHEWAAIEWAWLDTSDEKVGVEPRWVICRHVQVRRAALHVLISYEFYEDEAGKYARHYDHLLATLRLAEPVTLEGRGELN